MINAGLVSSRLADNVRDYFLLCKPRVNALIVFTAVTGMILALPPDQLSPAIFVASLGILLAAYAAAVCNGAIERQRDAAMARTRGRPLVEGRITATGAWIFAAALGTAGLAILFFWVNILTTWLTLATFVGYVIVYTVLLKPSTPQNIVIGGAAGAMPPVLGWAAMTNSVTAQSLLLFFIIFAWTPPHFWSLALYHRQDYVKVGIPMLPVVRGGNYTRTAILAYTFMLVALSFLPCAFGMSGPLYLIAASLLGLRFLGHAFVLYKYAGDANARTTFRYSIVYLFTLFATLMIDHFL